MASSSYYKKRIKNYKDIKSKMQGLLAYFDNCISYMNASSIYMENLIINNKAFDDGKVKQEINNLTTVYNNLQEIIEECNKKITNYNYEYEKALKAENRNK